MSRTGKSTFSLGPHAENTERPKGCYVEVPMTAQEIDAYLEGLNEPKRSMLQQLRETILEIVPEAEQCISYGLPAFRVRRQVVAGFAAFKNHLSCLPHSGSVIPGLGNDVVGYGGTKSSLHFPVDRPLPRQLVEKLIAARLREIDEG